MAKGMDTAAYLRRLCIAEASPPSVAGLHRLHAAHVERVAYEVLDIQLGRPVPIEPDAAADRIVRQRRGGYCYHLNGAFSLLLRALGYDVTWHRAGVQVDAAAPAPGPEWANHLTLTVRGLPSPECPAGTWLVDVGLGDALHAPLPLRPGRYAQPPFAFELRPSEVVPGGWRWEHDPGGSFVGMDFRCEPAGVADFAARHAYLSTSPESAFVRTCTVQRRDATGIDALTGCVLARIGTGAGSRTLERAAEWYEALADVFGLPLDDFDRASRDALWARVRGAHEAWLAAQSSYGTKSALRAPQTGQYQSSGMSANAVPGGMPPSGSPSAGS